MPSPLAEELIKQQSLYGYYPHLNPKASNKPDTLNTPEHRSALAEALLSMAPGSGEALSLRDSWDASGRAGDALMAGNYGQAASEYGNLATALLGALPGAGVVARGTKRGAAWMDRNLPSWVNRGLDAVTPKDAGRTLFSGAGPTDALPMDEASRMARAKDMGFDTDQTWYHGTAGDHAELSPSYFGDVSSGDGGGFWFTKSPSYAWEYALNAAGKRGEDPRIINAFLKTKKPLVVNFDGSGNAIIDGNKMDFYSNGDVIAYARDNGYDSVLWPDGSFTDEAAATLFDNSQIRDATAAFDKKKAWSGNLLAGAAGASIVAPGLLVEDER